MTIWKTHSMGHAKGRNGQGDEDLMNKKRYVCEDQRIGISANATNSFQKSNDDNPREKVS